MFVYVNVCVDTYSTSEATDPSPSPLEETGSRGGSSEATDPSTLPLEETGSTGGSSEGDGEVGLSKEGFHE